MKTTTTLGITAWLAMAAATAFGAETAGQYYTNGINDLAVTNLTAANTNFANAVSLVPTNAAYNVFHAMTELLTVPTQPAGSAFLTRLGISAAGRNVYKWKAKPEKNAKGHLVIPTDSPPLNADEFTAQLRTDILPALAAAQSNLTEVTDTNFTLDLTTNETHESAVTMDWGDAQMLQAMCGAFELYIYTIHSWNLDIQLSAISSYFGSDGSFETFLTKYPSLLTTVTTADLPAAQGAFTGAVSNYFAASQFIRNRPPDETRLFNLGDDEMQKELEFRQTLSNLLASLTGPVALTTSTNNSVSAQAFFSGNLDARSYLPQFQGDDFVWDSFPDTTFGGVVTGLTEKQAGKFLLKHFKSDLDLPGASLSVLYNFTGVFDQTGVVQATNGTLYGTLNTGGPYINSDVLAGVGYGSVFKVTTNGQFKILYNFGTRRDQSHNPLDGAYPNALVLGSDGNLYGTTEAGGANLYGTVFKITTSGQLSNLYNFNNGAQNAFVPAAALVEGSDGRFYGTTSQGGNGGAGTVFAISTNGALTNLYSFSGGSDGGYPAGAPLVQGTNGLFYGTTPQGGGFGYGTIFQIDPSQPGQIVTLHTFGALQDGNDDPLDGALPNGLVQGADGNLYGTTEYGGANDDNIVQNGFVGGSGSGDGTLFSISPGNTNSFTSLFSFDENFSDGYNPIGSLVPGTNGVFYGVASAGGANKQGAVFSFSTNSSATNIVWLEKSSGDYSDNLQSFTSFQTSLIGNSNPSSAASLNPSPVPSLLTAGFDGSLYGTTTDHGSNGNGTIYKLNVNGFPRLYTLTVNASPANGGTVSVNGTNHGGIFTQGSTPVLTATANPNFEFVGWSGSVGGTNNALAVTMTANLNITAIFLATTNSSTNLTLTVLINGAGLVSSSPSNPNGKNLKEGASYILTAAALGGDLFSNWTGSIISSQNPLPITVETNLVLEANFVPNPFTQFLGTYNGLFSTTSVTEKTAGMLKGLIVGTKGAYSGTLLINGTSKSLMGNFNLVGQASEPVSVGGQEGNVDLAMTLTNNPAPQVTGTVSGTNNGIPWEAILLADLATNTVPGAQYTMLMLPDTNNAPPTNSPGGDGYAWITNYQGTAKNPAAATANIIGTLADGTAFNQMVPVSYDGHVPIYASLYTNGGLLLGWIDLDLTNTAETGLTWIHPKTSSGLYTNGFTNILLTNQIQLSLWATNLATNIDLLTNLSLLATINDMNPLASFIVKVSNNFNLGKVSGPTNLSGSINPKTGQFTVAIGSGTHKTNGFGAILLNGTNGGGYFLTKTNAQAIQLEP